MGALERTSTKCRVSLAARTVVGRSSGCRVKLANHHASGEHARLTWSPSGWHVRDLASTNGTWLGGARLSAGRRAPLVLGAMLGFGDPDDPWCLVDEGPPGPAAWRTSDDEVVRGDGPSLIVVSGAQRAAVSFEPDGSWRLDVDGARRAVSDGESVIVGGAEWTLLLPPIEHGTRTTRKRNATVEPLASSRLEFNVSSDEEHVELTMHPDEGPAVALPHGKSCYYVLVTLARLQLAAEASGTRWVDVHELGGALRYSIERVNVEIHRARKLLAQAGVPDAFCIVERTRDGRIRVGAKSIAVHRQSITPG